MAEEHTTTLESEDMPNSQGMRFRFDPGFSLGHILGAFLTVVPMLVGLVWVSALYASKIDTQQKQMDQAKTEMVGQLIELKSEMTRQLSSLKADASAQVMSVRSDMSAQFTMMQSLNDKQVNMIRTDIMNIPGMKERVDQLDKRMDAYDNRFDAQSRRLDTVSQTGTQNQADIAGILRILPTTRSR